MKGTIFILLSSLVIYGVLSVDVSKSTSCDCSLDKSLIQEGCDCTVKDEIHIQFSDAAFKSQSCSCEGQEGCDCSLQKNLLSVAQDDEEETQEADNEEPAQEETQSYEIPEPIEEGDEATATVEPVEEEVYTTMAEAAQDEEVYTTTAEPAEEEVYTTMADAAQDEEVYTTTAEPAEEEVYTTMAEAAEDEELGYAESPVEADYDEVAEPVEEEVYTTTAEPIEEEYDEEEESDEESEEEEEQVDLPPSIKRDSYEFMHFVLQNVGIQEASDPKFVIDVLIYFQQRFAGTRVQETNVPEYTDLNTEDFETLTKGVSGEGELHLPFTPPGLDFASESSNPAADSPAAYTPFTEFITTRFREGSFDL